ncbi:MAG: sugar ABC transporter permease [Candidatus Micrarchaeia archaeon]
MKKLKQYYILNLPSLFFVFFIGTYLILFAIKVAIFDYKTGEFILFLNISRLTKDSYFLSALNTTIIYVIIVVLSTIIVGLFIAEFLHYFIQNDKLKGFITLILIFPLATAPVAVGVMGRLIFTPEYGIMNVILQSLKIINGEIKWFSEPLTALFAVIFMDLWEWSPYVALVSLAGLQSIPKDVYEAAQLDGASKIKTFQYIDLEYLKPLIFLLLIFRTADEFKIFDIIMVMTKGGPGFSTETLAVYLYRVSFKYFDLSYGALLALLVMIAMIIISSLLNKLLWTEVIQPFR